MFLAISTLIHVEDCSLWAAVRWGEHWNDRRDLLPAHLLEGSVHMPIDLAVYPASFFTLTQQALCARGCLLEASVGRGSAAMAKIRPPGSGECSVRACRSLFLACTVQSCLRFFC